MTPPYRPSLLRLLHAGAGLLLVGSWCTGVMVYNRFDGRFGRLPLPTLPDSIDVHGSLAVGALVLFTLLGLYSLSLGRGYLFGSADPARLKSPAQRPQALRRLATSGALLAATLAVASGRMMEEDWLEDGRLTEVWYQLHLLGWLLLGLAVLLHVLLNLGTGGREFTASMFSPTCKPGDRPRDWPAQLLRFWKS